MVAAYEQTLTKKVHEFLYRIEEAGYTSLISNLEVVQNAGGAVPATADAEGTDVDRGIVVIRMVGNEALFVEFGTGVTKADAPQARADLITSGVAQHGGYGSKRGASQKGWFFKRSDVGNNLPADTEPSTKKPGLYHTYGQDAEYPLYRTKQEIERQIGDIAREVFG